MLIIVSANSSFCICNKMEFAEFIRTPMVDGVTLYRPNVMPAEGTLCITGHHLILSSRKDQREELWVSVSF